MSSSEAVKSAFVAALLLFTACKESGTSTDAGRGAEQLPNGAGANYSVHGLIVVLGSSTSAGTGPKEPKNAWVRRYQARLAERFPKLKLVNLAVGGQTTFEIQPTGYVPPPNRPAPVPGKNITAALALRPDAIIVNLPSNDQASNYTLAEQLANYDRIASLAADAHVQLWVSTTQPRNFGDAAQLAGLMQARDAIVQKFAPRTLDFWTPFATPNGHIKAAYDAGDGTHLNDAAHAILERIVEDAHIPEQLSAVNER